MCSRIYGWVGVRSVGRERKEKVIFAGDRAVIVLYLVLRGVGVLYCDLVLM